MPAWNYHRLHDPQMMPRLLFFLQALLWYGDEEWLWRIVDLSERSATTDTAFDLCRFLYYFRLEVGTDYDSIHRRIYHRVDAILQQYSN